VWDDLLGAVTVRTPDPLFDAMVNRWLLYQTIACRMWAKAGLYQAGGAFGFRDQLQDAMALAWSAPQMLREQIVVNAARQFAPATSSIGGMRRPARVCAPISATTCCGCACLRALPAVHERCDAA